MPNNVMTEMCAILKNYFLVDYMEPSKRIHYDTFTIANGDIDLSFLQDGQYFRVVGSVFNDGVWQYVDGRAHPSVSMNMTDETFEGAIWAMSVPPDVVQLSNDISDWIANNSSALNSPYTSESFGGYSYTKASGGGSSGNPSAAYGWQDQFASRLAPYRRLSVL